MATSPPASCDAMRGLESMRSEEVCDRRLLKEYAQHYNRGRPHRSLDLAPPDERPVRLIAMTGGRVKARPVLGGLFHEYELEAA